MIVILLAAGYSRSSAEGRISTSHPLFKCSGPDRYRIITDLPDLLAPGTLYFYLLEVVSSC